MTRPLPMAQMSFASKSIMLSAVVKNYPIIGIKPTE
jgi:hypothetical protein